MSWLFANLLQTQTAANHRNGYRFSVTWENVKIDSRQMLDISRIFYLDKVSEVFLLNIACETMMMKTKFSFSLTTRHFHALQANTNLNFSSSKLHMPPKLKKQIMSPGFITWILLKAIRRIFVLVLQMIFGADNCVEEWWKLLLAWLIDS